MDEKEFTEVSKAEEAEESEERRHDDDGRRGKSERLAGGLKVRHSERWDESVSWDQRQNSMTHDSHQHIQTLHLVLHA